MLAMTRALGAQAPWTPRPAAHMLCMTCAQSLHCRKPL